MLCDVPAGDAVTIAYTELYAGRDERRGALRAKKAFECECSRCNRPPLSDAQLDGWKCAVAGCTAGAVAPDATSCGVCATAHALKPSARAAIEGRWREAVDSGTNALLNRTDPSPEATYKASLTALATVEQMLSASASRLCAEHMLRHKAHRLRVYALNLLPDASGTAPQLVAALQVCVDGMAAHLPPAHPELAFYRHWLAKALVKQAAGGSDDKKAKAALRKRAKVVGEQSVAGLEIAYGADHPTVAKWREGGDEGWVVGGSSS